jgi:hypothetical protein
MAQHPHGARRLTNGRWIHLTGFLSLAAILFWIWNATARGQSPRDTKDPFASIKHSNKTCQVTTIFPFLVGCPERCERAVSLGEPMYRMAMSWYFAGLKYDKGQAYDLGINYQCPDQFVDNFRFASRSMETILTKNQGLRFKAQERMHLNLAYLCCLRRNETDWAREIMHQWVLDNYPFDFDVELNKVECWHERYNSVTNIIIADDATQQTMLKMNRDLERKLLDKGIPTEVPRTLQMPFHVTLFGVFRGESFDLAPEHDISPDIPEIYEQVSDLSSKFGSEWTSKGRMKIRHAPHCTPTGILHAGKEITT